MDGRKKLEELVASIKGHPDLTTRFISAGDIRSISDAFEAENERASEIIGNLLRCERDGAGLCDCVDNDGEHYPSQDLTGWIKAAEEWISARNVKDSHHDG